MAIIIPSKNIYGDIDNPKIISNLIDNVSIDTKEVLPNNEYEISLFNGGTIDYFDNDKAQSQSAYKNNYYEIAGGATYNVAYAYSYLSIKYAKMQSILIPVVSNNQRVDKILTGLDKDGNAQIKYRIIGNVKKGTVTANVNSSSGNELPTNFVETETSAEYNVSYELPEFVAEGNGEYGYAFANAKVSFSDNGNILSVQPIPFSSNGKEYFRLDITLSCGLKKIEMGGGKLSDNIWYNGTISGTYELFEPVAVEVTIYGNTVGISVSEKTITIGSGNHPFSISGDNELMQNEQVANSLATQIRRSYANGKEVATLVCGISDYKDENGNVVISTTRPDLPMIINIGDSVIPMIRGIDGADRPMSIGKTFEVLDVKHYYDGAVWQKIIIKEIK